MFKGFRTAVALFLWSCCQPELLKYIIPAGAVAGLAVYGGMKLTEPEVSTNTAPAADTIIELSAGRQQLLDQKLVGNNEEFKSEMKRAADKYFATRGAPCDPVQADKIVGNTLNKTKGCQPAPGR